MKILICLKSLIWLISFALLLQSCGDDPLCNCLQSSGNNITESRLLESFHTVELSQNIDLILRQGNAHEARVTAGKNIIDGIKTEVKHGILYIRNDNKCNWLRDFKNKFTVELTFRDMHLLTYRGSGIVECADTIRDSSFTVEGWNGTGTINLILNVAEAHLYLHTGSTDLNVAGVAPVQYLYCAGNGYIRADQLNSNDVYAHTATTGQCYVHATHRIDALIRYHGNIYYKGNPSEISTEFKSSGRLIPM